MYYFIIIIIIVIIIIIIIYFLFFIVYFLLLLLLLKTMEVVKKTQICLAARAGVTSQTRATVRWRHTATHAAILTGVATAVINSCHRGKEKKNSRKNTWHDYIIVATGKQDVFTILYQHATLLHYFIWCQGHQHLPALTLFSPNTAFVNNSLPSKPSSVRWSHTLQTLHAFQTEMHRSLCSEIINFLARIVTTLERSAGNRSSYRTPVFGGVWEADRFACSLLTWDSMS